MLFHTVLSPDNIRRLSVPEALNSVDHLKDILRKNLQLDQDFVIQVEDPEFGNELCNLTAISDLPPERAVLKVISQAPAVSDDVSDMSSLDTASMASSPSTSSSQSSSSLPLRTRENSEWPSPFPIPTFSYDVGLRLAKANEKYRENGTLLDPPREMISAISTALVGAMFSFSVYPTKKHQEQVAMELIKKHPCLKDPSIGTCYDSWAMRRHHKVGNYRSKLKETGCNKVMVNKKRGGKDGRNCLKKAKRCEINFLPDIPAGQCNKSLLNEKAALQEEMKKRHHNNAFINTKMELTFSLRRKEIVNEEPPIADVLAQWPVLFLEEQACA